MEMIGICGDNCAYCPRYIATQNGSAIELEKVKELWVRLGFIDPAVPVNDMACSGCRPENKCAYKELRTCVYKKGIENCGSCHNYPCELINAAFDKSDKLRSHAIRVCTQEEMDMLNKAFFSKKQYFDTIHRQRR